MAGFYVVRDEYDTGKADNPLDLPAFPYEAAYIIQDRMFKEDGSLFYPAFPGDPFYEDFIVGEEAELPPDKFPDGGPSALAEFFGDVMTVNGKAWPKTNVEPRQYRLRLLNGCDSRFLILRFKQVRLNSTNVQPWHQNVPFTVIGTDHGLGTKAKKMETLLMEPGSRYDVIVNFKGLEGRRVIMWNVGPDEPYSGDFDDISFPKSGPGFMRTGRVMAFDVTLPLDKSVPDNFNAAFSIGPQYYPPIPEPTRVRKVALFEGLDEFGRLMPLLGTVEPATDFQGQPIYWPNTEAHQLAGLAGKQMEGTMAWHEPSTENPKNGTAEEWEVWNLSGDAHPIHLHLVRFEILGREEIVWDSGTQLQEDGDEIVGDGTFLVHQPIVQHNGVLGLGFRVVNPTKGASVETPSIHYEDGPKDMVTALPGQVTRFKTYFDQPGRFVWHCHILAHEDHEMMRVMYVSE